MLKSNLPLLLAAGLGVLIAALWFTMVRSPKEGDAAVEQANAAEIHAMLSENVDDLFKSIGVERYEASMPLDGKGPRILVRVPEGQAEKVPPSIVVDFQARKLKVPLEASETYEVYDAQ